MTATNRKVTLTPTKKALASTLLRFSRYTTGLTALQWILPDGHQWHPAAQSWVDLDWWDYERADEIAIRMVLHTVVAPVVQQYFGCGAALLGTLEDIFTTFYLVDPVPIELSFMVSFWDANG